jgi:tetratricopeptide (TPR) repeat protein
VYDPRREERRRLSHVDLPDDVEAAMLDPDARRELRSLSQQTADTVARHLVVVGRTLDDEPERALRHARAARALAGRVGPVREAAGLAAYTAGEWAEALSELRAARRITGHAGHLAVLADCERALGRPERALALGDDPAVPSLTQEERVELVMVLSGARRDLGQADAAVLLLQGPAERTRRSRPWAARLWYALADALLDAGRADEARQWFAAAADADEAGATDADERLLELDGVVLEDLQAGDDTGVSGEDEAPDSR